MRMLTMTRGFGQFSSIVFFCAYVKVSCNCFVWIILSFMIIKLVAEKLGVAIRISNLCVWHCGLTGWKLSAINVYSLA